MPIEKGDYVTLHPNYASFGRVLGTHAYKVISVPDNPISGVSGLLIQLEEDGRILKRPETILIECIRPI